MSIITSIFWASFIGLLAGVALMSHGLLKGQDSFDDVLENLFYAYFYGALFPLVQQYNPSRRVFGIVKRIAFWRPSRRLRRGGERRRSCYRRCCCCCSSPNASPEGSSCCSCEFTTIDMLRLAGALTFKWLVVDFFAVCQWQIQRERTLRIIRTAIARRGEEDFSIPFEHAFRDPGAEAWRSDVTVVEVNEEEEEATRAPSRMGGDEVSLAAAASSSRQKHSRWWWRGIPAQQQQQQDAIELQWTSNTMMQTNRAPRLSERSGE